MEEKRITFVVGAGASTEFGLPTGRALLKAISSSVSRLEMGQLSIVNVPGEVERAFSQYLLSKGRTDQASMDRLIQTTAWICQNCQIAPSIDNLLHSHNDDEEVKACGKALLSYCITQAERASSLFVENSSKLPQGILARGVRDRYRDSEPYVSTSDSWLARLFWLLAEESNIEDFKRRLSGINFVVFNYDRCIEHFLLNAAASYFRLNNDGILLVKKSLNIVHTYGDLGDLSIENDRVEGFGSWNNLVEVSTRIATFTDQSLDEKKRALISHFMGTADQVIFLGFGFLKLNMDLLFSSTRFQRVPKFFATTLGISPDSKTMIQNSLQGRLIAGVEGTKYQKRLDLFSAEFLDVGCKELLDHFHFRLRVT